MQDGDELVDAWRDLSARASRATRCGRGPGAEDHVQDAIVAALEMRHRTGRTPDAPRSWLGTVARRREVDTVRRAVRERRAAAASAGLVDGGAYDVDVEVLDRHEAYWLAAHVEQLPARTRDVVRALGTGASQADVATTLGLTPRAVEGHVRRARLALRRALERAGSVAALLRGAWLRPRGGPRGARSRAGGLRLRRRVPVVAAGAVAAVVATGYLFPDVGPDRLVPLPPPKRVERPALPRPGMPGAGPAVRVAPAPFAAAAPAPLVRRASHPSAGARDLAPTTPPTTPPPVPLGDRPDTVVAMATGRPVPSNIVTDRNAWYDITVSGTYSYNAKTGLADGGHYLPEHSFTWSTLDALFVDGVSSPCVRMPFSPLHTYTWRQRGTGDLLWFRVNDWGGADDNVGALSISITKVVAGKR
jgi:DNA-directed RNA polymerase specialized sigma24 family protein